MGLTRADILEFDTEVLRETAECHGQNCDELTDDQVLTEFADLLDSFEVLSNG